MRAISLTAFAVWQVFNILLNILLFKAGQNFVIKKICLLLQNYICASGTLQYILCTFYIVQCTNNKINICLIFAICITNCN